MSHTDNYPHHLQNDPGQMPNGSSTTDRSDILQTEMLYHDIYNALQILSGRSHHLQNQPTMPPHTHRILTAIHHNAHYLHQLFEQLVQNKNWQLSRQNVLVSELLKDHLAQWQILAQDQGISLHYDLAHAFFWLVDPVALCQVLNNLIGNAFKFAAQQDIMVRTCCRHNTHYLEIQDQGPGLSLQQLPYLFEAFQQIPGQQSMHSLGLGLTITRHLCEQMQLHIELISPPEQGCLFRISQSAISS